MCTKEFIFCIILLCEITPHQDMKYSTGQNVPQCPDNFVYFNRFNMCVLLTESKFPPECPFQDNLLFDSYKIVAEDVGSIWMPVTRDSYFGKDIFDIFRWIENSIFYKTPFNSTFYFNDTLENKDCLLYHNSSYIEAVSCEEEHLGICAYPTITQLPNYFCAEKNCRRSDFSPDSKCFCLGNSSEQTLYTKAEFLYFYQNNVYANLTKEKCTNGLKKISNETYIWSKSVQEISYKYWSPEVLFDDTHIYGASTPEGWILTQETLDCVLFEKEVESIQPQIALIFDNKTKEFRLDVINPARLKRNGSKIFLFCLTDAASLDLLYRIEDIRENKITNEYSIFFFGVLKDGPGNYRCEGISESGVKFPTEKFFLRMKDLFPNEFVAIFQTKISDQNVNPISNDVIKFLNRTLITEIKSVVKEPQLLYNVRLMSVMNFYEFPGKMLINVHFTSQENSPYQDKEFYTMKNLLGTHFNQTGDFNFKMMEFLSSDYCIEENYNNLLWSTTPLKETVFPDKYCFKKDTTRLNRTCLGDFMTGARWENITETCEIFNRSEITEQLENFLDGYETDQVFSILKTMSQNTSLFSPLDLYIIGNIFANFDLTSAYPTQDFVEIVSNILNINRQILKEAQIKMNVNTRITMRLRDMFKIGDNDNNNYNNNYYFHGKNFCLVLTTLKVSSGIAILKDFYNNHSDIIFPLRNESDIAGFIENNTLEAAVWIEQNVVNKYNEDTNIFFMFFFKDSFFIERVTTLETSNIILGLRVPLDEHEIIMLQNIENRTNRMCSSWQYDNNGGSWAKTNGKMKSSYQVCEFDHDGYFTLTSPLNGDNVTISLLDLLHGDFTVLEITENLRIISRKYEEFTSYDVFLVGKILQKMSVDQEIDLDALAETVSNLHEINRTTLQESQLNSQGTDLVLRYLDKILINHHYQSCIEVLSGHFYMLIYDTKDTNLSGVALIKNNQTTLKIKILEGDADVNEVVKLDNLTSAVIVNPNPPNVEDQLENITKIVITVFVNDAFFNEKNAKSKRIGNVFGVILPEIKQYSGAVSVLQKKDSSDDYQPACVHWNYSDSHPGFWHKDHEGEELSSWTLCKFWHTTHFALLLLDHNNFRKNTLDWLTGITCGISLLSCLCIVLTAIFFKRWRNNSGNLILLNVTIVNICQMSLLYISDFVYRDPKSVLPCIVIGISLHYFVISHFCWMLVIAFLQFKRFVDVLGSQPNRILIKSCLCGWGLPLVPVFGVFSLQDQGYTENKVGLCYPSGLGLYLGVWFPISLVILINLFIFMNIIYSVCCRKRDSYAIVKEDTILHWRLAFFLFFVLGLTWIFGFLAELDTSEVFVFLFTLTATLQGSIMFLFFIILNDKTRTMYLQTFKRFFGKNS